MNSVLFYQKALCISDDYNKFKLSHKRKHARTHHSMSGDSPTYSLLWTHSFHVSIMTLSPAGRGCNVTLVCTDPLQENKLGLTRAQRARLNKASLFQTGRNISGG